MLSIFGAGNPASFFLPKKTKGGKMRKVFELTAEGLGFKLGKGVRGRGTEVWRGREIVGYVPLSHFDPHCKYSMADFVEFIFELDRKFVVDEVSYDYGLPNGFNEIDKQRYEFVHGCGNIVYYQYEQYFDGRLSEYNEIVVGDFWRYFEDPFENIDPDEEIMVYHYEGKDWYIAPYFYQEEAEVFYYNDDKEIVSDWAYIYYHTRKSNELVVEAYKILEHIHWECEVKGTIANNLGVSWDLHYNEYLYEHGLFNLRILDERYNRYDLMYEFFEWVDWDMTDLDYTAAVERMYEKWLEHHLDEREYLFGIYKHLPMVKALFKERGIELEKEYSQRLKKDIFVAKLSRDGVEADYHFLLKEVYDTHPKAFVSKIEEKLKAKFEKLFEEKEIIKNASRVFVGIQDSIRAGNCKAGTLEFASKHNIDPKKIGGIRGDVLLSTASNEYEKRHAIRAVAAALKRAGILPA